MTFVLLLLSACQEPLLHEPKWTYDDALRPTWERLDVNMDGQVRQQEWGPVSYGAPEFSSLDADASGGLSLAEFQEFVRGVDPDGFDGKRANLVPESRQEKAVGNQSGKVLRLRHTFHFLRREVEGVEGVEGLLTTPEEVEAACQTKSLGSPESRAVLKKIRAAWLQAGFTFPEGLTWIIEQRGP